MMTHEELIELAYSAAHNPERWEDFLDALLDHEGVGAAAVGYRPDVHDPFINGFLRGLTEDALEDFFARAVLDDPLAPLSSTAPVGYFSLRGNAAIAHEALRASDYGDWMARNDLEDVLLVGKRDEQDAMVLLTVFTRPGAPHRALWELLEELSSHVARALTLCQEYIELTQRHRQALSAMEHTRFGCALLGQQGQIAWMNDRAQRLLERAGWLDPHERVVGALREVILGAPSLDDAPRTMNVSASDAAGERTYEVRIVPWLTMGSPFGRRDAVSALLFIADPEHLDIEIDSHIQVLYGVTEAEARVARYIVSGYSVENIAAILSRSSHTIRKQLKSAMRKCQVSSQAQLVGLVHRGLAMS